jgi:hypothetical protein
VNVQVDLLIHLYNRRDDYQNYDRYHRGDIDHANPGDYAAQGGQDRFGNEIDESYYLVMARDGKPGQNSTDKNDKG